MLIRTEVLSVAPFLPGGILLKNAKLVGSSSITPSKISVFVRGKWDTS